ncbi:MAG: hypothetical protein Kow00121_03860 [Elainellaceae cyanobacterium]
MLWYSFRTNVHDCSQFEMKPYLQRMLKRFWQFSNFYGEYTSLPPSARGKLVEHYTKTLQHKVEK